MLLYVMLYIMLAYLMLFTALFNAPCLYNTSFFPLTFINDFFFALYLGLLTQIVYFIYYCASFTELLNCWFS